jgi:hypothetical protein
MSVDVISDVVPGMPMRRMLTARELASLLGVSAWVIGSWSREGVRVVGDRGPRRIRLARSKMGHKTVRYDPRAVERFVRACGLVSTEEDIRDMPRVRLRRSSGGAAP